MIGRALVKHLVMVEVSLRSITVNDAAQWRAAKDAPNARRAQSARPLPQPV